MIKWITKERAEKEGKGTQLEAAECSLKRWEQGAECTYEELRDGMLSGEAVFGSDNCGDYCALCWYREKNKEGNYCEIKCIGNGNFSCCSDFYKAREAFDNFQTDTSRYNCDLFQTKAKALCEVIQKFMEGLQEPKMAEFKHGDYGYSGFGNCAVHIGNGKDSVAHFEDHTIRCSGRIQDGIHKMPVLGNIFSDLARNAEDLREFVITDGIADNTTLQCSLIDKEKYNKDKNGEDRCICIEAKQNGQKCSFVGTIAQAKEIHQKLGQIIATALRDKRKGK